MSESLTLTIRRHGEFSVRFTGSNVDQCGLPGTHILRYDVRIVGDEDHLTEQGFIIDNNAIHSYFVRTYETVRDFESCERIAARACRDFKAMFGSGELADVLVREIEVTIAGGPNAGLTAHWQAQPAVTIRPLEIRGTSIAEAEGRVPGTPQYERRVAFEAERAKQNEIAAELATRREVSLADMMRHATSENRHPEQFDDAPRGREFGAEPKKSSRREIAPGVVGHQLGGYSTRRTLAGR